MLKIEKERRLHRFTYDELAQLPALQNKPFSPFVMAKMTR